MKSASALATAADFVLRWAGKLQQPVSGHTWGVHVFFRLLGLVYLLAFASLALQIRGLSGSNGILPASWVLNWARESYGAAAPLQFPTLFWADPHDLMLTIAAWTGCFLALLAITGVCLPLVFGALWFLYLSFVNAGGFFFSLQWDALLLETGFLAILLAPRRRFQSWNRPEPISLAGMILFGWLLFRLMFFSGWVKLASGDPAWSGLRALEYHFETQPLPTPLSWHAHQLPPSLLVLAVIGMFGIELILPFFLAGPRLLRRTAALAFIVLQAGIALTGNYGFFNFLSAALAAPMLDDAFFRLFPRLQKKTRPASPLTCSCCLVLLLLALPIPLQQLGLGNGLRSLLAPIAHWRLAGGYGLFAVMTRDRPELVIEGSQDGFRWKAYSFKFKPTDDRSQPAWIAPHMPRLDWQLWFAALGPPEANPWVRRLLQQLRHESPEVLALFAENPFPEAPPRWLRVRRVLFSFATPEERKKEGRTWASRPEDLYMVETPPETGPK